MIRGPGITFTKPPRRRFDWTPVVVIGGTLLAFALLVLLMSWPMLLQGGIS